MINFVDVKKQNMKQHKNSGPRKINSLFNVISHQQDIDKIYFYDKESYEP